MTKKYNNTLYILYAVLFCYFLIAVYALDRSPQIVNFDPGLCLKMVDNEYKNIPFNYYVHPNPQNLNQDQSEFVTWWSPGQFMIPLAILDCFHIKISASLKILILICMVISALGIFRLFKNLLYNVLDSNGPLTDISSLLFLVFSIFQPFFWNNLYAYDGGGVLMLAYCPWFIIWILKIERINFYILLLLLISGLAGFTLKTSFTSTFMAALVYLLLSIFFEPGTPLKNLDYKKFIVNGIYLLIVFSIYMLVIKTTFLNHNRNIADSSTGSRIQPRMIFFPLDAPLLGLFALDSLNKTYQWIIAAVFVLPIYYLIIKSKLITLLYKYLLISFISMCVLFYGVLYFLNLDVSYELRHFRTITLLLTPAVFISMWEHRPIKYVTIIIMIGYSLVNIYHYASNLSAISKSKVTLRDFSGLPGDFPSDLTKKIRSLDNLAGKGRDIFYFKTSDPSIALEIRNNRVLLEDNFINFHFDNKPRFNTTVYLGRNSGQIYIIYPTLNFKRDSSIYLTKFERYKSFEKIYETAGYNIYRAIPSDNQQLPALF